METRMGPIHSLDLEERVSDHWRRKQTGRATKNLMITVSAWTGTGMFGFRSNSTVLEECGNTTAMGNLWAHILPAEQRATPTVAPLTRDRSLTVAPTMSGQLYTTRMRLGTITVAVCLPIVYKCPAIP